jgi:hypothetical protein
MAAMLQAWSKSTISQRVTGVVFLLAFGAAATWGAKILLALRH